MAARGTALAGVDRATSLDEWQRQRVPLTLILSGSALRLMEDLLGSGAPLFGRADRSPLTPKGPETRRASYRLTDPFFRFWFRFVFPNRSLLERGRVAEVQQIVERDLDSYMGPAFEDVCRDWAGRFGGYALPASQQLGSWWSRDGQTEIDVVGVSRGRYDLLGSCKWAKSAPASTLTQLLEQRDSLPRAAGAKLAIFARGFSAPLRRRADEEDVALIELDQLFG